MASTRDRIERSVDIKAAPSRVWRALTDHREFGEWFRVKLEGPFVVGTTARGNILYPGYEHLVMEVFVRAMEPERYFAYNWHPFAVEPGVDYSKETPTLVEFRLEAIDGGKGTRLRVCESGFDKIPASRRDEAFRMNSGGWEEQVGNLERYVTGA